MTVSHLTITGAWDTENTLLLNYAGTAVPLTVLNGLTLATNAQIVNFNSGLVVQDGSIVVSNAQIIQDGGYVSVTNARMNLSGAQYYLTNGVFEGGNVWLGAPFQSSFNQYGGSVLITNLLFGPGSPGSGYGGAYFLYAGFLNLPAGLTLMGDNGQTTSYFQSGGTNQTTKVFIEPGLFGISPSFKLNGGLLADDEVDIIADNFGSAVIEQNGGSHIVSANVQINGAASSGTVSEPAIYYLNGGTLGSPIVALNASSGDALFIQTNGSAQVQLFDAGGSAEYSAQIQLFGGTLTSSNLFSSDGGIIYQSGGALMVSNTFGVLGYRDPGVRIYTRYTFLGGTLIASNIDLSGDWIIGDGTTNRISNAGKFSLSHTLQISNAVEQLGQFILVSNATINLAGNASQLSFANSSGEIWANSSTLSVTNWNGNPSGGGAEQLRFGLDQSGLTPAQLNQIQFQFGTNSFPAKILNTGEVVPDNGAASNVTMSVRENHLVLTWPAGWTLQSATNVPGPYFDVSGATSPYTNDMRLAPQLFFRLRL